MTVASGLDLGGCQVVAVLERAAVVEPVDVSGGGDLEVIEALPRPPWLSHLGLIEPDHGLGQSVVVRGVRLARGRPRAALDPEQRLLAEGSCLGVGALDRLSVSAQIGAGSRLGCGQATMVLPDRPNRKHIPPETTHA